MPNAERKMLDGFIEKSKSPIKNLALEVIDMFDPEIESQPNPLRILKLLEKAYNVGADQRQRRIMKAIDSIFKRGA